MRKFITLILTILLTLGLTACGQPGKPNPQNPVTLTIWHTYVENMQATFDTLVTEFNSTVGAKNGITVKVEYIANASVINEQLVAAAKKDPGAPALPDLAVVYPKAAVTLADLGVLSDLGVQFSPQELAAFVPQFLEEGRLGGDTLYLLPVAKSTEVLYLNRTIFDRFASETGVTIDSLGTFEGLADAAVKYFEWTDAVTPDIPNDGKMFYYPDGLFNYSMIGFQQLGGEIVKNGKLNLSAPAFQRIFDSYYTPAVKGGTAIFNDYANHLAITGDIVCATSTSAGAFFFPTKVTYPDNTKEDVVFDVLPYPVFEGGKKTVFQRGGGICVTKSTPEREYAAGLFLKWFTAPEQNLTFTAVTGYMPVTQKAFDEVVAGSLPEIENPLVEKTLIVAAGMQKTHAFYFPPVFDGFDGLQTEYVKQIQAFVEDAKRGYKELRKTQDADAAFAAVSENAQGEFVSNYRQ